MCPDILTYLVLRFIGVADLASVRFSLPSQLLEPTPNLEYWNYLDAPNAFIAIGTSDEPLDRMLEVLRFWFTKDLKYAKGKPCKPYNSCLGEFFRVCHTLKSQDLLFRSPSLKRSMGAGADVDADPFCSSVVQLGNRRQCAEDQHERARGQ